MKKSALALCAAIFIFGGCAVSSNSELSKDDENACVGIEAFTDVLLGYGGLEYTTKDGEETEYSKISNLYYELQNKVVREGKISKQDHEEFWKVSKQRDKSSDGISECELGMALGEVGFLNEFFQSAVMTYNSGEVTMTDEFKSMLQRPSRLLPQDCYYTIGSKFDPFKSVADHSHSHYNKELDALKKCFIPHKNALNKIQNKEIVKYEGEEITHDKFIELSQKAKNAYEAFKILANPDYKW